MTFYTDGIPAWNSLDDNTRAPLSSELEGGYPCGEADQELFNWTAGWPIGNIWNMLLQSGITPDTDKLLDLARAIQTGKVSYAAAAGTANALTATLSPVPASINDGFAVRLLIASTNTGAATLNLNGLGVAPILNNSGAALSAGDLVAGSVVEMVYHSGSWMALGLSSGRLINVQTFKNPGTSTYTPTPGTRYVIVEVQGAGGSGGGAGTTGAGVIILGSGGASGAYAKAKITSGFSGVTVTVGAKGVNVAGDFGVSGGASSFGALVSCPGGPGGSKAGPVAAPWNTGQSGTALPSGGNILSVGGNPGGVSVAISANQGFGAIGGASLFGSSGAPVSAGSNGASAITAGSGGGGTMSPQNQTTALKGGDGADGIVIVWEYA